MSKINARVCLIRIIPANSVNLNEPTAPGMLLANSIKGLPQNLVWILLLIGLTLSCEQKRDEVISTSRQTNISSKPGGNASEAHFLISSKGDTIFTGVPIPAKGKWISPDSVAKPRTIPLRGKPKVVPTHTNVHLAGAPKVVEIPKKLKVITPGKNGVPLPKMIPAHGKVVSAIQPRPIPTFPLRMKDAATSNIQYLDVNQGMPSSYIFCMLEDKHGYLWFGSYQGVIRYDGNQLIQYTTKEGFSHNDVFSMFEDSQGDLWFGTDGGIFHAKGKGWDRSRLDGRNYFAMCRYHFW